MTRVVGLVLAGVLLFVCSGCIWWHEEHEEHERGGFEHERGFEHEHGGFEQERR